MQPPKSKGKQESALIFPRDTIPEPIGARFSTQAKKGIMFKNSKKVYWPSFLRDQQTSHSLVEANEKLVSVSQKEISYLSYDLKVDRNQHLSNRLLLLLFTIFEDIKMIGRLWVATEKLMNAAFETYVVFL